MRKLEIGAGNSRLGPDWETSDIRPGIADHCLAAWNLHTQFPENTFDQLYACMVLEHIPRPRQRETLCSWYEVLKPDGVLEVIVPNMRYIAQLLAADIVAQREGIRLAYGDQDYPENTHVWGFTEETLAEALTDRGFMVVETRPTPSLYAKAVK